MKNAAFLFLLLTSVLLSGCGDTATNTASNTNTRPPTPPRNPPTTMPEFPWPPRASAFTKIPPKYLPATEERPQLKDVANRLEAAFNKAGYGQVGYYSVPSGFALVSRLEQYKANGLPVEESYRWLDEVEPPKFFSLDYWITLIGGKTGRYRVVVFAVSPEMFVQSEGKRVDSSQARNLAIEGANELPKEVGDLPYTDEYICMALIYEFEKPVPDKPAEFKENGVMLAEGHLRKILAHLEK